MDRYGLTSGKRIHNTLADVDFAEAILTFTSTLDVAMRGVTPPIRREADRNLIWAVRRLVRAALDVERQRCFEKGMEAFAAMPMVRERHDEGRSNRWTPGTYCGE